MQQIVQIRGAVSQVLTQLSGESADFFGAPVNQIEIFQQRGFAYNRLAHRFAQLALDFVQRVDIGGIGHDHEEVSVALFQHHRAVTPGDGFRQQFGGLVAVIIIIDIDQRDAELVGKQVQQAGLVDHAQFDQGTAELAPQLFLFTECELQLILGNQSLFDEQVAQSDFLGKRHQFNTFSRVRLRFSTNACNRLFKLPSLAARW